MEAVVTDAVSTNLPDLLDRCLFTGVVVVDDARRVTALSDEAGILLGLRTVNPPSAKFDALPSPLQRLVSDALTSGDGCPHALVPVDSPEGESYPLHVATTLISGPSGKPAGVVLTLHDMAPIRRLEAKLRQMDRLASVGTLSASMAHEVKNALVAVKTFVDLLIAKNQDAKLADIVGREMQRINSIVSQMLRFGGPARPSLGTIHLHQVIEQSLNLVQHHIEGRKITVTRSLDAVPDTVPGDAYQLEQAFLNLFLNAFDAMGVNGELSVRTEFVPAGSESAADGSLLRIFVQDNGMGIPPENLSRLFEPFFTTKPTGTGLGLAITRRIIQEHRGKIEVHSVVNRGTCFTLTLPSVDTRSM